MWFYCRSRRPEAEVRLFCFPSAGGATVQFFAWPDLLPDVEVHVAQLPGRERRLDEPLIVDPDELLRRLAMAASAFRDRPAAFYGHSMGALVAFELARCWKDVSGSPPVHLFAAARRSPQLEVTTQPIHHLADEDFVWHLEKRWGALPGAVREDPDLLRYFMPALRADVTLLENYRYRPQGPLECPITVYGGQDDPSTTLHDLSAWRAETRGPFDVRLFAGDHFFPQTLRKELTEDIAARLRRSYTERRSQSQL
jgi:medium-chain acyl-[acyl-carrier-protein] hydrolase